VNAASRNQIAQYQIHKYIGIALDSGSIKARSMLTVSIVNAISGLKAFTLSLIPDFRGDKISYIGAILASISEVCAASLIAAGFVCDKERVKTVSLQDVVAQLDEQPELRCLMVSRCACHTFGPAFDHAVSRDGRLTQIPDGLTASTELLRSKPIANCLSQICAAFCPSRWSYACQIARFITNHSLEILDFIAAYSQEIPLDSSTVLLRTIRLAPPITAVSLCYYSALTREMQSNSCPTALIMPF
jgi:hypothetical protein